MSNDDEVTILIGALFMALIDLYLWSITEGEWCRPLFGGLFLLAAGLVIVVSVRKIEAE